MASATLSGSIDVSDWEFDFDRNAFKEFFRKELKSCLDVVFEEVEVDLWGGWADGYSHLTIKCAHQFGEDTEFRVDLKKVFAESIEAEFITKKAALTMLAELQGIVEQFPDKDDEED